ncbi:phage terminase large subunit [Hyphomicrobium sp. DY-1]|uniref:phage terminase large subunit n=1 Tax=Hyphomicrobium sp. DY-1 TaxID=3075650 RepID=UPI0039C3DAD7
MRNSLPIELSLPPLKDIEIEIDRRACTRSFAEFAKRAWHVLEPSAVLKWGWSLDAICEHLEAVNAGEITELLMNVPPGCMKSLLTGVLFPAWEWGPMDRADLRYLGTSHNRDLAIRDNMKCRRLIQSDWYQDRWPIVLTGDQNAKTKFENDKTGFREAMAFTSMTGSRGDRVILDDPLSVDEANSEADLLSAEITFTESLPTRVNNEKSAKIVIMQRLNQKDTSGIILARSLNYVHLMLPMEFEPDRKCVTSIGFEDPRTEDGELLFPERFSAQQVEDLKKTMGSYAVAGQFQQRPAPREGGMFKRAWFGFVGAIPAGTEFVRGWDLAASTEKTSAFSAGVKMGATPNGRYVIANCRRDRLSAGGVERLIVNTAGSDGQQCAISLPQDPGQAGKAQSQYLVGRLAGFNARATPESGDKATRAEPLAAQAEAGNVDILRTGDPARDAWIEPFLDELSTFPGSQFKDQTDAATRAFMALAKRKTVTKVKDLTGFY